ncbi:MAG: nuclear transport factor 2 family protein [Acidobacteriota bacterium]
MNEDSREVAEQILEIERSIFVAIKTSDDETLGRFVAEDFVLRTPGQPEIGRTEFLESVKSIQIEILEIWSDDMKVNAYGDVALLTGVQQARTRGKDGKEQLSASAFSDVFAKRNGEWVLVLAYNVELPETKSESSGQN